MTFYEFVLTTHITHLFILHNWHTLKNHAFLLLLADGPDLYSSTGKFVFFVKFYLHDV